MLHYPKHNEEHDAEHKSGNDQLKVAGAVFGGGELVEEAGVGVMVFVVHEALL